MDINWDICTSNLAFIHGRESDENYGRCSCRAVLKASTEPAHTTLSGSLFQWITVSTKNECLYCWLLLCGTLSPFVLLMMCLSTMFVVSQSLNTFAFIVLFGLAVVTNSVAGKAGTSPSTTLYNRIRRRLNRQVWNIHVLDFFKCLLLLGNKAHSLHLST